MILPVVLTVAGSDSSGGAGIQADLKTFHVCGVHGATAVTSITMQNTMGVQGRFDLPAREVERQIKSVVEDLEVQAAKTGMMANSSIIETVVESVRRYRIEKLVVDPVMVSGTGHPLLDRDAVKVLVGELFPLAMVITPNVREASLLTGVEIAGRQDQWKAARALLKMGPRAVVVKGGHLGAEEGRSVDVYVDGYHEEEIVAPWVETVNTHGTGCVFSAAIAAFLARGWELDRALRGAKLVVTEAIKNSLDIGGGPGPVHPLSLEEPFG